ncbi:membrane protein [Ureaplasma canigenitalium]|uniref:membrane protein n=1 Tax=Ureaplasma canigenitalium TaxID=42092 RepID=UPI0004E1EC07|nr:membrane protein [Ureaplasma canigenitalium]
MSSVLHANSSSKGVHIQSWQTILIFLAFVITFIIFTAIKKIYYSIKYQKRFYIIPRVSVKGISSIGMVISISVSIILLITIVSANAASIIFRAWPGTRVTLEGILIKIGGLLFGPILGIFIGAMTDLLSVALTAGVFHHGYLIASMAFGLIGGLIRTILTTSKKRDITFAIYSSITTVLIGAAVCLFLYFAPGVSEEGFNLQLFNNDIKISAEIMVGMMAGFFGFSIVIVWLCLLIKHINEKINKRNKLPNKKQSWFIVFAPVLVTILLTEAIVNVIMLPSFDVELTSLNYTQWLSIRALMFAPMIVVNLMIIYPIFKIVVPLIRYDYEDDVVEDKNVPLVVD